jgi:hypothetical protein
MERRIALVLGVFGLAFQIQAGEVPQWNIANIDRAAPGNRVVQLTVATDGTQHLVYTGCSDRLCEESRPYYAKKMQTWEIQMIDDSADDTGWFPSLALDPTGAAHIFYANHEEQELLYAKHNGSEWEHTTLSSGRGGWWTSAAYSHDTLYVANTKLADKGWENAALEVGTLKNGTWNYEIVDSAKNAGWFTSMAILPNGNPVVSYNSVRNQPIGYIKVAYKENDRWNIVDIDGASIKHHVATDTNGFIHVVYQKASPKDDPRYADGLHDLYYATNATGSWKKSKIQEGGLGEIGDTGTFPRMTVDAQGRIHVVFISNRDDLMYGRKMPGDNGWEFSSVDDMGGAIYPWIEVDAQGNAFVAYERGGNIYTATCTNCQF